MRISMMSKEIKEIFHKSIYRGNDNYWTIALELDAENDIDNFISINSCLNIYQSGEVINTLQV